MNGPLAWPGHCSYQAGAATAEAPSTATGTRMLLAVAVALPFAHSAIDLAERLASPKVRAAVVASRR